MCILYSLSISRSISFSRIMMSTFCGHHYTTKANGHFGNSFMKQASLWRRIMAFFIFVAMAIVYNLPKLRLSIYKYLKAL